MRRAKRSHHLLFRKLTRPEEPNTRKRTADRQLTQRRPPMARKSKGLEELFHDTLKDIYFAEKKNPAALPKMTKAAQSAKLKAAFEMHHHETEGHVARLEKV